MAAELRTREDFIAQVSRADTTVVEKNAYIVERCKGRRVLDLGCIDHSHTTALALGDQWLHRQIKAVASHLTGLDILPIDAAELNRLGYDIRTGDAERFDLGETYDVIVAGDLIEHLSNIGLFLRCVKRHMHTESIFIFSTPNPFNIEQALAAVLSNTIHVHPQHAAWLNPHVCWELTQREGLAVQEFQWVSTRFEFYLNEPGWRLFVNRWARWIMKRKPLCRRDFAVTLVLAV